MDITAKIETLKDMIMSSKRIAFLGGAGVSTESGIPDFRSVDGLYNQFRGHTPLRLPAGGIAQPHVLYAPYGRIL